MVLHEPPSCMGTPRSRQKVPVKILFCPRRRGQDQLMDLSLRLETPRLGTVWFLVSLPLAWERQGRDRRFAVEILPCLYTARARSVNKVNISFGLETSRMGIVWFLVSLPLAWECQGREHNSYQLKSSPASTRSG